MTEHNASWPPCYAIKKHRLAKQVKLKMTPADGLEITIPIYFNLREIPALLEKNKAWILKHIASPRIKSLPELVVLTALNATWKIVYIECHNKFEMIQRPNNELVLVGKIRNQRLCKEKLIFWIKREAKLYLFSQLKQLSHLLQLDFKKFSLRDQKTRWGSCTSEKTISLNYKLIFLPQRLLRHVIIHELCHIKHLNHSTHFWNEIALYDADWRHHRNELRHADQYIPTWI